MMTTSGCRVQSTARRRRFQGSVLGGLTALAIGLGAASMEGRAESLVPWTSDIPRLPTVTLSGQPLTLDDLRGRPVLVHFFATWCEPCGPELQALDRLQRDFGDQIAIISIDVGEPKDRLQRYLDKAQLRLPVMMDEDRSVSRAWGVYALPSSFVVDRTHTARWQAHGDVDWDQPAVRAQLDPTFANRAPSAKP